MNIKRFTVEPTMIRECIVDNTTGEQLDTFDYTERLCEVLNKLHDENQMLKRQYADDCNEANSLTVKIAELSEENEQLKQSLSKIDDIIDDASGKEYLSRDDLIKVVNKIDKVIRDD